MKRQLVNLTQQDSRQRFQREFYSQNSVDLGRALLGKVLVRKLPSGELLRGTIVETEAYPGTEEASLLLNVHCFITKQTEKNAGIFMEAGTTWVYLTYGVFNMINVSALHPGSACLLRAIEPKDDGFLDLMERLRLHKKPKMVAPLVLTFTDHTSAGSSRITRTRQGKQNPEIPKIAVEPDASNPNEVPADEVTPSVSSFKSKLKAHELANGPGKLCKAFHIEKVTCDQQDLSTSDFLWIEENDDAKYRDGKFEIIEATRIGIDSAPEGSRKDLFRFYIQDNLCVSTAKPSQILKKLTAAAESQRLTEGTGAHSDQK